jgi:hypothetical protein
MTNDLLDNYRYDFLAKYGISDPTLLQIKAGRNSKVWKITSRNDVWILKEYHNSSKDTRDRLGTEFGFIEFLNRHGIRNIPKSLACDHERKFGLYSYIHGESVGIIYNECIQQVADFIYSINLLKKKASTNYINSASEACFSFNDHIQVISERLKSLLQIEIKSPEDEQAKKLVVESLLPTFQKLEKRLRCRLSFEFLESKLDFSERILSPSDFGFHNVLVENNSLFFLDFEYAGWDDPAKLICDFYCQPELPVTFEQAETFRILLSQSLKLKDANLRAIELLPFYRLKWCCIILNEFRQNDRNRRKHAGIHGANMLQGQLLKAEDYFIKHLQGKKWLI